MLVEPDLLHREVGEARTRSVGGEMVYRGRRTLFRSTAVSGGSDSISSLWMWL
jgi:hypothetical protein